MKKKQSSATILDLLHYLRPYRRQYLLASLFSFLNKIFDIAPEVLIGVAVDCVVKRDHSWLASLGYINVKSQLFILGLLSLIIWCCESLFQYLYSVQWRNLAQTVQHCLRLDSYRHVQNFDMATFEKESTGNLLSILNDDINQLERFLEDGVNQIIQIFGSCLLIGAIFFLLAPKLALLSVFPIPLILLGGFYFQNKLRPRFLKVREKAGAISSRLANNISGIFTIKSFTSEDYELNQIENDSNHYREANRKAIQLSSLVTPVIRIAVLIGFLATLIYGGILALNGEMRVGIYSILIFLTQRLLWPLTTLAEITVLYQRAMASATRVLNLLKIPINTNNTGTTILKENVRGDIQFKQINFSYEVNYPILKDLSLHIPAGTTVALVGTTGSGKSTLVKLLLRFYQTTEGVIYLDGKDIHSINLNDLRNNIGIVSQDVYLFQGTVAQNIAYAQPQMAMDRIVAAAKMAEAHDFICQLPQGYQTIVGERGQKLSGGQRQRLAIARAILKDPPILILDEATSAVDNETELAIQKSLARITANRTTIIIAHRLSTIRHANNIVVLQNGQIIEQGNHESLLSLNQVYAGLWNLQTGQNFSQKEFVHKGIISETYQ